MRMFEALFALTRTSTTLRIAVGYVGEDAIIRLLPVFSEMVSRNARADIFIGRAYNEGLYIETLNACRSLHSILRQTGGGVYGSQNAFHSKIYLGQEGNSDIAWVGSSNLSTNGLFEWREANVKITSRYPSMRELLRNIEREIALISRSRIDLNQVPVVQRPARPRQVGVVTRIEEYPSGPAVSSVQVLELPLYSRKTNEVQESSGLNWWNGYRQGIRRNPNEACIGLSVDDIRHNLDFFPNRAHEGTRFLAYTDDGLQMEMQIEGTGPLDRAYDVHFGKQIASRPEKPIFGEWILRRKLNLPPWTLVTRQILQNYGRETIGFTKINDNEYIMKF